MKGSGRVSLGTTYLESKEYDYSCPFLFHAGSSPDRAILSISYGAITFDFTYLAITIIAYSSIPFYFTHGTPLPITDSAITSNFTNRTSLPISDRTITVNLSYGTITPISEGTIRIYRGNLLSIRIINVLSMTQMHTGKHGAENCENNKELSLHSFIY